MVTSGALDVLFVLLALEVLQTVDPGAAILNAALGLGTIVGGAATFSLVGRQSLAPVLAAAALLWGGGMVFVGAVAPRGSRPRSSRSVGSATRRATWPAERSSSESHPIACSARVLGALEVTNLAGLALGSVLVPIVVGFVGVQAALIAVGLLLPLGVGVGWLGLRRMDRTSLVPTRALGLLRAGLLRDAGPAAARSGRPPDTLADGRTRRGHHPGGRRRGRRLRPRVRCALRHPG